MLDYLPKRCRRMRWVQWHVAATGLGDSQLGHDRLDPLRQERRHGGPGSAACIRELLVHSTRQAVRPLREIAVADLGSGCPDRDPVTVRQRNRVEATTDRRLQRRGGQRLRREAHVVEYYQRPGWWTGRWIQSVSCSLSCCVASQRSRCVQPGNSRTSQFGIVRPSRSPRSSSSESVP